MSGNYSVPKFTSQKLTFELSGIVGLKSWVRGADSCNFSTDSYRYPTAELVLKVSKTFTLNSHIACVEK